MAIHLSSPVGDLPGLGGKAVADLKGFGISNVRDLLFYVPFRYGDFSTTKSIADLQGGDTATITVKVREIHTRPARNRKLKLTEAIVEDETGELKIVWFNQPYLEKTLRPGTLVDIAGTVDTKYGFQMTSPIHEPAGQRIHTGRIVPVYGLTGSLTMRRIRSAIKAALPAVAELIDWTPTDIITSLALPDLASAVGMIHFPESRAELDRSIARLKFNELFLHQLLFAQVRKERSQTSAIPTPIDEPYLKQFVDDLPFTLTTSQKRAAWEVLKDCALQKPMNRLLEGDVGSGKTVVAAMAIAHTAHADGRSLYMAPTELLARQQAEAIQGFASGLEIGLITSSQAKIGSSEVSRDHLLEAWKHDDIDCLVGTHALIQKDVPVSGTNLVIIDEQHRFGVEQRHALIGGGEPVPHLLSMTATPIPRSLALTLYGDLDLSILTEMPKGRKPVATKLIRESERQGMWQHVREQIQEGGQVFVVCPLIDPSDQYGSKSVKETADALKKQELKDFRVEILHGKMKSDEKRDVIERFRLGETDTIVSTTVVEVGVDIPGASVMIVTGAERFGLAQLHQLRGRVGRSDKQSYCYLLPDQLTPHAKQRLGALVKSNNGFELAEKDLELRGAGNVFGNAQSGFPDFKFATEADVELMKRARDIAKNLLQKDPDLEGFPLLKTQIQTALDQVHME